MKVPLQIGNLLLDGADVTPHLMRVRAAPAHDGRQPVHALGHQPTRGGQSARDLLAGGRLLV